MTTLLGYEFQVRAAQSDSWSGNNVYASERFTSPHNVLVSGITIIRRQFNWDGNTFIGIQGNNAGFPDNVFLASGIYTHNSGTNTGNAGCSVSIPFDPMVTLNSGTIYHIVVESSGTIGTGSLSQFFKTGMSGVQGRGHSIILGSLYNVAFDTNFQQAFSYDSGGTWNAGSVPTAGRDPWSWILYESGGTVGSTGLFGRGVYNTTSLSSLSNSGLIGARYILDKTYTISGVFVQVNRINTGSMLCRIEYSGPMVDGKREELGSIYFNNPLVVGINSTPEFYVTFPAGSTILVWIYGTSGLQFRHIDSNVGIYSTGRPSFGNLSGILIESLNAGSSFATGTGDQELCLYFAASGGVAEETGVSGEPFNLGDSFGGQFNYYG